MCALQCICLLSLLKKNESRQQLIQNVHIRSHTHALPLLLLLKNIISLSPFFSTKVRNQHGGVRQLQRKRLGKNSVKCDSPTGIKILQPVIFHLSYSPGIVLWSPLRGIKSPLINIIEVLQITTLSNHQEGRTHKQGQVLINAESCWVAAWKSRKIALWFWTFIKGYVLHTTSKRSQRWKMHNS